MFRKIYKQYLNPISLFKHTLNNLQHIGIPLFWHSKHSIVEILENSIYSFFKIRFSLAISALIITTLTIQVAIFYRLANSILRFSYFNDLLTWAFVFTLGYCWFFIFVVQNKIFTLRIYINGHLKLKETFNGYKKSQNATHLSILEKLSLLFSYLLAPICLIIPYLIVYGVHFRTPCKTSLFGFWLLSECGFWDLGHFNILIKLAVFLVNHWIWWFVMHIPPFVSNVVVFGAIEFSQYIYNFKLMCCETLLYDSKFVKFYRNIQVLAIFMNELQGWSINSVTALFVVILQAVSLAALTRQSWNGKHWVSIIFVLYSLVASVIVKVGVFGLFARVNLNSEEALSMLSKRYGRFVRDKRSNKKLSLCFYKSCNNIKVRLGTINYVGRLTPLNFIDISNTLTVNLLLVK